MMSRSLAVAVVLLFVLAPLGFVQSAPPQSEQPTQLDYDERTAVQSPSAIVTPRSNGSNYLAIPDDQIQAARTDRVSLSVDAALVGDDATLQTQFSLYRLRTRYQQAETSADRRTVIQDATENLREQVSKLNQSARQARVAYIEGKISTYEYLRTLSQLNTKATVLQDVVVQSRQYAEEVPQTSVEDTLSSAEVTLLRFRGPVRDQIDDAFHGRTDDTRIYVAVSEEGVTLATIDKGSRYVRETYLASSQGSGTRQITSLSEASDRIATLYPWVWNHRQQVQADSFITAGVSQFALTHTEGVLITYLDLHTADVYYEIQRNQLEELSTRTTTEQVDQVRVIANYTHAGGPLQITVVDNQTGNPVAGTVRMNNTIVGTTGPDGHFWTILPEQETDITVTRGSTNVTLTVSTNASTPKPGE